MRDKRIEELEQKIVRVEESISLLPVGIKESFQRHLEPPEEEFLDF
jgi:hypothetical protein